MNMTTLPKSILITGASSGIGRALALGYAAPDMHLALMGRNPERLSEVELLCRTAGAKTAVATLDVRARKEMAQWIHAIDDRHPIDLGIASAGITTGLGFGRLFEDADAVRAAISINFMGVLNTLDPLLDRMRARGRGQVAVFGSISGVRGMPQSPAYCASKAALHAYAEGLRGTLARQGVSLSLVVPGFVETPLNRDIVSPKPLQISDVRAARIIRRGLDRRAALIAFPRILYYGAWLLHLLPARWADFGLGLIEADVPETRERASEF
jgi:short-subunit dehydrogenase